MVCSDKKDYFLKLGACNKSFEIRLFFFKGRIISLYIFPSIRMKNPLKNKTQNQTLIFYLDLVTFLID